MNWGKIRPSSLAVVLIMFLSTTLGGEKPTGTPAGKSADKPAEQSEAIQWHTDVDKAWAVSKSEQRLILLFITYKGCAHCRKMAGETYGKTEVVLNIAKSFVPAKLSGEEYPGLIEKLGIRLYPTTLIITPDAARLDTISGYKSPQELQRRMAAAVRSFEARKR